MRGFRLLFVPYLFGIPLQLCEEWEAELVRDFGSLFNLGYSDLLVNSVRVQEVPPKNQRILGSVNRMYPSRWYKECDSGFQGDHATFFD